MEARSELTFPNFSQLYRTLMFDAQKNVSGSKASSTFLFLCSGDDSKELKSLTLVVLTQSRLKDHQHGTIRTYISKFSQSEGLREIKSQ